MEDHGYYHICFVWYTLVLLSHFYFSFESCTLALCPEMFHSLRRANWIALPFDQQSSFLLSLPIRRYWFSFFVSSILFFVLLQGYVDSFVFYSHSFSTSFLGNIRLILHPLMYSIYYIVEYYCKIINFMEKVIKKKKIVRKCPRHTIMHTKLFNPNLQ